MTSLTPALLIPRLKAFVTCERGTVAVARVFFGGAVVALAITATAMFVFGADAGPEVEIDPIAVAAEEFRQANGGHGRETVLVASPTEFFTEDEVRARYRVFSDPRQTSDGEVRDAHRTWARRVDDHAYSQPGRARDMVLILEHALAARLLEPHRGF